MIQPGYTGDVTLKCEFAKKDVINNEDLINFLWYQFKRNCPFPISATICSTHVVSRRSTIMAATTNMGASCGFAKMDLTFTIHNIGGAWFFCRQSISIPQKGDCYCISISFILLSWIIAWENQTNQMRYEDLDPKIWSQATYYNITVVYYHITL